MPTNYFSPALGRCRFTGQRGGSFIILDDFTVKFILFQFRSNLDFGFLSIATNFIHQINNDTVVNLIFMTRIKNSFDFFNEMSKDFFGKCYFCYRKFVVLFITTRNPEKKKFFEKL